jgi:hypothetical protein
MNINIKIWYNINKEVKQMLSINVCTVNGKSQEFVFNPQRSIGEIKSQVIKHHEHLTLSGEQEIKLLYKGIELDEFKTLEHYGISARSSIQIIHKTKPISISRRNSDASMSASSSASIFESYAPSPLNSFYAPSNTSGTCIAKSPSPITNAANDMVMHNLTSIHTKLEHIINHLAKLEQRVAIIYDSVVPSVPSSNK